MSTSSNNNLARVLELLSDQATAGLAEQEHQELSRLMAELPLDQQQIAKLERGRLDRAVGVALGMMMQKDRAQALPASLRDKLLASGMAALGNNRAPAAAPAHAARPGQSRFAIYAGWLVAAASIALAAVVYFNRPKPIPTPTVFAQAAELARDPSTIKAAWVSGPHAVDKNVTGQVEWNTGLQKGFLRLKGITANDPTKMQYQLWIFDKGRIEPAHNNDLLAQNPIDGGVFDVSNAQLDPATGDYIIPIDPKLAVRNPGAFAVTTEVPGGVVVTKRESIILLAPVGG